MGYLSPLEPRDGLRRFRVTSPLDGSEVLEFAVADAAAVKAAIDRARAVQPAWAETPVKERSRLMAGMLANFLARQDEVIERLVAETGRTRIETMMIELFAACDAMNYYGRRAPAILAERRVGLHLLRHKRARIGWKPLGVVGVISPWNGPFILSINPTIQAVLAGNAVVLKPSEVTPCAGLLVEELFREAGFPEGLVQTVLGDGETGAALIEGGVDKVCFTGSVRTGRKVGEACGRQLIPCTLELGGKDPMIVCADANLDRAAGGAVFGALFNAGQFCSSVERVYVVAEVAEAFIDKVVAKVQDLELERDIGPFIFEPQAAIVAHHVGEAVEAGARVLVGGALEGNRYQPTVVVDVDHSMALMRDETFGPVIPIQVVADEDEAVRLANDTEFGLSASVWTTDRAKGEALAHRIQAGSVTLNETSMVYGAVELPFGGRKSSGVGAVNGAEGLRDFCTAQPILADRFGLNEEGAWFPFTPDKVVGLKKALNTIWGTPLRYLL